MDGAMQQAEQPGRQAMVLARALAGGVTSAAGGKDGIDMGELSAKFQVKRYNPALQY